VGAFLKAAYEVLKTESRALSAPEITRLALERRLLTSSGKTPSQTMKARLSVEILRRGTRSTFMRTAEGEFGLREWSADMREHVAQRYKKSLFDEDIVVFPAASRQNYVPDIGLYRGSFDHSRLLDECFTIRRREAEEDLSVIQLVSVFLVRYQDRFLTFKRTKRLPEARLHGFYSISFGGHLNPDDVLVLFNIFDADQGQPMLLRELYEELRVQHSDIKRIQERGLLYDDSREVSKQHLGLVYEVELASPVMDIGERGFLIDPKFESLPEINARLSQFENWSVILAEELSGR
jgi:predicted NUDIX family phosphoesterase